MFFIAYQRLSKRGHIRMDVLAYPDGSTMSFDTYDEAEQAAKELVDKGLAIIAKVRKV